MDPNNKSNSEGKPGPSEEAGMGEVESQSTTGQTASPRDSGPASKRSCPEEPEAGESSPRPSQPPGFMVPPSPPKFVSMDEILKAAQGVSNMVLAHEIAVDNDFKLEKHEAPQDSLERRVKEIMHKAFWDVLEEKLNEDPPDYQHALILLQEVKEALAELFLPHHGNLKNHINEVLDLELIRQKAEHGALDVGYYGDFVIGIMAKLCAPARDEMVAKIKDMQDLVPRFKAIMEALEVMKMDMANFTIQQIRPFIQQQSVEYEKRKFDEFLKTQKENNLDGLQHTRDWLARSANQLQFPESPQEGASSAGPQPTPAAVLNTAYMELLKWDERKTYPETLLMDAGRFMECGEHVKRLSMVASVLLVTYSTVGAPITGLQQLKVKLKDDITVIIGDTPSCEFGTLMENIAEQVQKEVAISLSQHGFPAMDEARRALLKKQIVAVTETSNPVHAVIRKRVMGFIYQLISTARPDGIQLPPGLTAVAPELNRVCGQFVRLISHNRAVFGSHYADLIGALLHASEDDSPTST